MKIPGVGDVKGKYVAVGGVFFAGAVGYAYYRKKKTATAAQAAVASSTAAAQYADSSTGVDGTTDGSAMDPYAYGGSDPFTGQPYAYENYLDYGASASASTITTNQAWASQAESDAQNLYGATYAVAQDAVEHYMAQAPGGLPSNEYLLMQSVVAELGPPPTGGPYRLIQSSGTTATTTASSNKTIAQAVGQRIQVPVNIVPPMTMAKMASAHGIALAHLIQNNPGSSAATTGPVKIPYDIRSGDTLDSLAKAFGLGDEHMEQILQTQGIT